MMWSFVYKNISIIKDFSDERKNRGLISPHIA
jgi:hypothetical protein